MIKFLVDGVRVALHPRDIFAIEECDNFRKVGMRNDIYVTTTTLEAFWSQLTQPLNVCWVRAGKYILASDRIFLIEEKANAVDVYLGDWTFNVPVSFDEFIYQIDKIWEGDE